MPQEPLRVFRHLSEPFVLLRPTWPADARSAVTFPNGGTPMNCSLVFRVFAFVISVGLVTWPARAQEKSVRPGINKAYRKPDVKKFVERFEREGREVYDLRHQIVEACGIRPGMAVADIGAGTGLFTRLFAEKVRPSGRVYAVDISKPFVDYILETSRKAGLNNVQGVVCTPTSCRLPRASIDLAFICDAYHHFEFPYKTMRSIYRALKPGGEVVLVEFKREKGKSLDWILKHVRAGKETFRWEIELCGFEFLEERTFPAMKKSYFLRFRKSNRTTTAGHTKDSLDDVKRLVAEGTALLIDVREQQEWDAGHLTDARLLPLSRLRELARSPQAADALAKELPKDKIIYCHCRSGGRVLIATSILKPFGYDIRPLKQGYQQLLAAGFE
ncbi:MAG TPA: methyltransferase domain-containing protein, partial [Planctomycetaceae bacterium]|nr:methyltransferase domain-containing protein [Planctomycetaceae bacterium]